MPVFFPVTGTSEEPVPLRPADTAVNDLLTVAAAQELWIIGLIVANEDASNALLAKIFYTIGTTDYLFFTGDVPAGESVHDILPAPIRLSGRLGTRKIRVQAEAADKLTFTVIYAGVNTQVAGK